MWITGLNGVAHNLDYINRIELDKANNAVLAYGEDGVPVRLTEPRLSKEVIEQQFQALLKKLDAKQVSVL